MIKMMAKCKYHPHIDSYMDDVRNQVIPSSEEIKQAMDYIETKLNDPNVFIDSAAIEKGVELMERYFEFKILDWELFIFALIHCFYKSNDTVVLDEFLIVMGRGNGKNGVISPVAWYLTGLLYTSDAADEEDSVDLGGRRIIKKKK